MLTSTSLGGGEGGGGKEEGEEKGGRRRGEEGRGESVLLVTWLLSHKRERPLSSMYI